VIPLFCWDSNWCLSFGIYWPSAGTLTGGEGARMSRYMDNAADPLVPRIVLRSKALLGNEVSL